LRTPTSADRIRGYPGDNGVGAGPPPHYLGHRKRLRDRYLAGGWEALHDYERVELLLTYALPRREVKPLAKDLLARFGGLRGLLDAPYEDLTAVPGLGPYGAALIRLVKDLGAAYLLERAREGIQIACTADLIAYCKTALGGMRDERFYVVYLDTQNRLISLDLIQEGTVNQAFVPPRKVLEGALRHKASAMILIHNHPSGHVRPSEADVRLTRAVCEAASTLEIRVHDHVIVGGNDFFSFREEGVMPFS